MSDAAVRAAFEVRLKAWADAQTPPIPVAFENAPFVPPAGRYVRVYVLPARTVSLTLDGLHRQRRGLFYASLFMPAKTGPGEAAALAASLDAAFPLSAPMVQGGVKVFLLSPMSAAAPIQEPDRYIVPVSAQYQADTFVS